MLYTVPMNIIDPLGVPAAPQETLQVLMPLLEQAELSSARLTLVTDRQGDRENCGYAAVLKIQTDILVTAHAFGPRFGQEGAEALATLVNWATEHNVAVFETVLNPSDFTRVIAEPDQDELAALTAASNPTDPNIYTKMPEAKDPWE